MTKSDKIRIILRQLNGEADPDEKKDFSSWLLQKPENLDLYVEIKKIWELPMKKQFLFGESEAEQRINLAIKQNSKKFKLWKNLQRVAAVGLLAAVCGTLVFHKVKEPSWENNKDSIVREITKSSAPGEQLRITLPDGSIVRLNAGSTISYPEKFDTLIREVALTGEAFFQITKDPDHPFVVKCGQFSTTVLGTSFDIKSFRQENVTVTVATGKVKVKNQSNRGIKEITLLPNEQAIYDTIGKYLKKSEVVASNYYDWIDGNIRFNNDSLEEVMKILERWYNVKIYLRGNIKKDIMVNGCYKDKKLYSILDGLAFMYGFNYHFNNEKTIYIDPA